MALSWLAASSIPFGDCRALLFICAMGGKHSHWQDHAGSLLLFPLRWYNIFFHGMFPENLKSGFSLTRASRVRMSVFGDALCGLADSDS